jgi:chromosome segregation ATPase
MEAKRAELAALAEPYAAVVRDREAAQGPLHALYLEVSELAVENRRLAAAQSAALAEEAQLARRLEGAISAVAGKRAKRRARDAEIRRLAAANGALAQQISFMEAENGQLAADLGRAPPRGVAPDARVQSAKQTLRQFTAVLRGVPAEARDLALEGGPGEGD